MSRFIAWAQNMNSIAMCSSLHFYHLCVILQYSVGVAVMTKEIDLSFKINGSYTA